MNKKELDICIPSYNRLDKLMRTLNLLVPQVQFEKANILIIDNNSEQAYEATIKERFSDIFNKGLFYKKNESNIGLSGNLLKCYEFSKSDYLILLADDDIVLDKFFKNIITELPAKEPILKFGAKENNYLDALTSLVDYCQNVDNFDNFIFTSNLVFNRRLMINYLQTGYLFANSYIPHFMMILEALKSGNPIRILNKDIVQYEVASVGYNYAFVAGLGVGCPKLLINNLSNKDQKKFLNIFFHHNDLKVLVDLAAQTYKLRSNADYLYLAKQYLFQIRPVRSLFRYLLAWTCYIFLKYKFILSFIIKKHMLLPSPYNNHIKEILTRYKINF